MSTILKTPLEFHGRKKLSSNLGYSELCLRHIVASKLLSWVSCQWNNNCWVLLDSLHIFQLISIQSVYCGIFDFRFNALSSYYKTACVKKIDGLFDWQVDLHVHQVFVIMCFWQLVLTYWSSLLCHFVSWFWSVYRGYYML